MARIAADTHAIIWYLSAPAKLSAIALQALTEAEQQRDPIHIPSICLVETQYLVERGRLPADSLRRLVAVLRDPQRAPILTPLDLRATLAVARIPRTDVPDMPDRIIAATALYLGVPLVTRDRKIRAAPITTIW